MRGIRGHEHGTADQSQVHGEAHPISVNPNPPAKKLASDNEALTSGTPAASTQSTSCPPFGGNH
jgi:hypothetical protein